MRRESLLQTIRSDSRCRALKDAGVKVSSLGRPADGTDPTRFTDAEIAATLRHTNKADIILSLKEQPLHLLNQVGQLDRPVVVCLHRSDPENQGRALVELHSAVATGRVASVVCCAESTRAAYQAAGVPARLLTVIPNGVDLARFRPVSTRTRRLYRRELGVPLSAGLVVFAARYDGMKNVPLFLAAARDFLQRRRNGHIVMCGAGMSLANDDLCGQLDELFADRPDLLRRLHMLGIRDDMPAIYAAADVVALTSSNGEAAPLCLIEGMMCGAIPVATDVGDCQSIVEGHGIICPPEPAAISAGWDEAIARRSEWAPALEQARMRFSQTRMAAAYASVIDEVRGFQSKARPSARRMMA
jgi:glycosyltransferase involved in cell wall biosynthesis